MSGARARAALARAMAVARGPTPLALLDQAVVSAASFLAVLAIGRLAGPDELGAWALAASIVALAVAGQDALVSRPYTILRRGSGVADRRLAGAALLTSAALSLLVAASLALAAFALGDAAAGPVLYAVALVIPLVLMREFARRHAFASLNVRRALALDATASALFIAATLGLALFGTLTAPLALAGLAAANAATVVAWLWSRRRDLVLPRRRRLRSAARFWAYGRWLLLEAGAAQVQGYAALWLSFALLGAASAGVYAASLSIVALANPLLFGFMNILTPRCVAALRSGGSAQLWTQVGRDTLLVGATLGAFAAGAWLVGPTLLALLYPGPGYAEGPLVLTLLAAGLAIGGLGVPAVAGLAALGRARLLAVQGVCVAAATMGAVLCGLWWGGLAGGAAGVLAGELLQTSVAWIAFRSAARPRRAGALPGAVPTPHA